MWVSEVVFPTYTHTDLAIVFLRFRVYFENFEIKYCMVFS